MANTDTSIEGKIWYFLDADREAVGPFSMEALRAQLESGSLSPDTLVAPSGSAEWRPLNEIACSEPPPLEPEDFQSSVSEEAETQKQKPSEHPIFVFAWLVFFFPVGVYLLWRSRSFPRTAQIAFTVAGLLLVIWLAISKEPASSPVAASSQLPSQDRDDRSPDAEVSMQPDLAAEARSALLELYWRLEKGRDLLADRDPDEIKWLRSEWVNQLERAKAMAESDFFLQQAAGSMDALRMMYVNSNGVETDSTRTIKEALADNLNEPDIVELRRRSDFDFVVSATEGVTLDGVRVATLADAISGLRSQQISIEAIERGLFEVEVAGARLVSFNNKDLFYSAPGESMPTFAIKRTERLESRLEGVVTTPEELYLRLIKGEASEHDPLRLGKVLVTSGYTWEGDLPEEGSEILYVRLVRLTEDTEESSLQADGLGVVLESSLMIRDEAVVEEIERVWNRSGDEIDAAFARLRQEGATWTERFPVKVRILQEREGFGTVQVEAVRPEGLRAQKFWVYSESVLPMRNPKAQWLTDPGLLVSYSSFRYVLDGQRPVQVGAIIATDFSELIAALYQGALTDSEVAQCLVLSDSVGNRLPCSFRNVVGDYLIYEAVLTSTQRYQVALLRDAYFERGYDDPMDLYRELAQGGISTSDPIHKSALVYLGREDFTTEGGLLLSLPVFRVAPLAP